MVNKFETLKDSRVKRDILLITRIIKVGLVIAFGNTLCVNAAPIISESDSYVENNKVILLDDNYVHAEPEIERRYNEKNADSLYSEDSGTEDPVRVFINNENSVIEENAVENVQFHKDEIVYPLQNVDMDIRRKKRHVSSGSALTGKH